MNNETNAVAVPAPAEKQTNYRKRKEAKEFSERNNLGNVATPEDFMVVKAQEEAGPLVEISIENLDAGFGNRFIDALQEYDEEDGMYTVDELLEAWDSVVEEWYEAW